MKLSEHTLNVLKNFAAINSGVVLEKGNIQKTMHPEKTILVEAELEDTVPADFGIYDLNQFLGSVTTLNNPDLSFGEKAVSIKDDIFTVEYRSCAPELIVRPPEKGLTLSNPDAVFELTNSAFTKIVRLASMNNLPNLSVMGKNGELLVQVHEKNNDSANIVHSKLGVYDGPDFTATFKIEHLKMLPDDYSVEVKAGAFAKFSSKTKKITYFIVLESK